MTRILDGVSVSALAYNKRHGVFVACNDNQIWTADGKKFIELENTNAKINSMIMSGGQLWAGTEDGIYVISLNRQEITDQFTPQNSALVSPSINTMFVDDSGIKWIGTDQGVIRVEGEKKWKVYEVGTRFTAITGNNEGVWLAGNTEMWLVDPYNRWTPTAVKEGLSVGEMRAVASDKQGRVYLLSDIFVQFDPYEDTIIPVDDQALSTVARNVALAIDNNDQLWVASTDEAIRVIDPEKSVVDAPLLGTLFVIHPTCAGASDGSIRVSVQGGQPPYQFSWNNDAYKGEQITALAAGNYELVIVDYAGNVYTDIAYLREPVLLSAHIEEDNTAEGMALVADATGGRGDFIYKWGGGENSRKIAVQAPGTYAVTVTDVNGCSIAASYVVQESAFARPDVDAELPVEEQEIESVTVENLKVLEAEELNVGQVLRIEQLQFQADSTDVETESFAVLDGIYNFLLENERIAIEIGGHTNGLPDHEYCDALSTARAKSVAEYIINKGIPKRRVQYHGYGKRQPIATNQTVEGRRKNQRVEVKILQM
jgi:outer membrane protein OmpA-like peptidoglycan-associated protein